MSHGFIGGIIDAIGDVAGAVGDAVGAVAEGVGAAFAAAGEAVAAAAEAIGITIRAVGVIFWHTDSLNSIELFPNGGIIGVVVSNLIHLWDPSTEQTTATLTHDADIKSIAVSPDGGLLASASEDGNIQLWNPNTEKLQKVLQGHVDKVLSVAFSPDGTLLASASEDNTVRLWNPQLHTLEDTLRGHTDSVTRVAFSPDGSLLASASADNTVRMWNPQLHTPEGTLRGHTNSVLSVAFSPDGLLLASASTDNTVRLWNPQTAQETALFDHKSPVLSIAFSPDREILASGSSDGAVRLWHLGMEKVIAKLGHESPVRNVAFSPDGATVYSTSEDGNMRKWEITTVEVTPEAGTQQVPDIDTTPEATQQVPDIQQTHETTTLVGFNVLPGDNTSLVVHINHGDIGFFSSPGFVFRWRQKEPQGLWHEACIEMKRGAIRGKGSVIISNLTPNTTYQVQYRSQGLSCTFYDHGEFSDKWSSIAEGTTSEAPAEETTSEVPDTNDTSTQQPESTPATTGVKVSISPASVASPAVGQQLTLSLNIAEGENVAGYQATVQFDTTALRYVSGANGDYLPAGAFFVEPKVEGNLVKLNAASLAGESNGDGTLATLTFEVIAVKASTLTLSDVLLTNSAGKAFVPTIENAQITETTQLKEDINGDGIVNIQDLVLVAGRLGQTGTNSADVNGDGIVNIQDLVLVAGALGTSAAAPSLNSQALEMLTATDVKQWLSAAQQLGITNAMSQRGILFLQQLLVALTPKKTALLPNYPNPFNPETWIPYHLAKEADVTLHIYAMNGTLVRTLTLGHQAAGMYQNRSRAAYWDGKNVFGEPVASGVYFYTLTAGDFSATRKMLIRK
ncbi:MAG: cohesin domain-containing protein [Candidatus Poribacteria bacterium]|nr:cohesin domain-containing protein [Candidatus Poribacteria bacterium]